MSATYRFTGEQPEVFLRFSGVMVTAGVDRDALPWRNGESNPDYQPPGELRPGQEFTLPEDLYVRHARIERKEGRRWVPTIEPAQQDEQGPDPAPAAGSSDGEA